MRLGGRDRATQCARGQARQQALLLFGRAARENGAKGHPLKQQQIGGVVADTPELLDGEAGCHHAVHAAIFCWKRQREETEFAQHVEHILRVNGCPVDFVGPRGDLLARHAADQVTDRELIFGELR